MAGEESAESLRLLHGVREELLREISAGRRIPQEIGKLIEGLPKIRVADELKSSMEKFVGLAAELYHARSSVSSTFSLAQAFYDKLIETAFDHAVSQLEREGSKRPDLTFAVLVSGEMGREESVLGSRSRFFFIYRKTGENYREYIDELAMRFMAVLSVCFPSVSRNPKSPSSFWYGSDHEWSETAAEQLQAGKPGKLNESSRNTFSSMLETAADMRRVCGAPDFGQSILESGRRLLADSLPGELFWHLAKDISAMPVALGLFGRFKTVRSGKNRGRFDLKEMAIDPLASSVRILSLPCGSGDTSFSGRIKSILSAGSMGVALADRLLIAYQDFMRERIRLELAGKNEADGLFFNPDQLDEVSRERFRAGMEDVTTVQRLVHQQLVEVEQG